MAESVAESGGFAQDLYSPLQFCEVVEEGQQQRQQQLSQQQLQQLHQHQAHLTHQQLTHQQLTNLRTPQPSHPHQPQHSTQQIPNQSQLQPQQPQQQAQQQSIKQETPQQTIQPQLLNSSDVKSQALMNGVPSVEVFLTSNPVQLQTVAPPLVAIHQQQLSQHMYQVQLTRHQTLQQLHLSPLQLESSSQPQNIQISQHNHPQTQEPPPPPSTSMNVGTINGGSCESFALPITTLPAQKVPSTTAVATQTVPTDRNQLEGDDEPEIIFTSVSTAITETPGPLILHPSNSTEVGAPRHTKMNNNTSSSISNGNIELKTAPIKRTWRRPWKKKKDREKKQPVKKARRLKRRRIVVPKKNVIHVDPRHGPPIDTSNTLVERESEETINQLKQKRQRIKLNRNSGREYVNRLGKIVRARKIGSPCNCPLKCWERMGSKILEIFNNFWDLCDFNLQNSYLFTCLKLCDVKRRYTKKQPAEESRRQNTFEYFVRISGKHLRVCKKAFMSSHGLTSDKRLRTLFTQMKDGALIPEPDRRGKHLRPSKSQQNGHNPLSHSNGNNHLNHYTNTHSSKANTKQKNRGYKKKQPAPHRMDSNKQTMYAPPTHAVAHLHPHCTPPPPPAHGTSMQDPPHAYIPNGEIYFPSHYLEPPQAMAPPHMNQIPSCQKMLETPAYFMAGMKENTFHQ